LLVSAPQVQSRAASLRTGPRLLAATLLACLVAAQTARAQLSWVSGDILTSVGVTTVLSGVTLTLSSASTHDYDGRAIVNNGTVAVQASVGTLRSGNSGSFTNNAAFNDAGGNVVNNAFGGTASTFTNAAAGTYTKTGTGTSRFDVAFNNSGLVDVQAGTFQLNFGGTSSGTFQIASGASVLASNTYALTDGSALTGAGTFTLSAGTLTATGNISATHLSITGGALAGTAIFSGALTWNGGNWNGGGTTTMASGATLTVSSGNDHDFDNHAIVNNGTVNWTGGQIRTGDGGSITNHGNWNDSASTNFVYINGGTVPVFTNASDGAFTKSLGGTTLFSGNFIFNNDGAVTVGAGTLQLNGGGTNSATGNFTTAAGATTLFSNNYTISNGSALGGLGTYQVSGGTFTVDGNVAVSNFNQTGGVLAGSQTFGGTSALAWSGGNWNTSGTTTIGGTATLLISTGNDHDYFGRAIVNDGTVNWTGGQIRSGGGGTITNNGKWNDNASTNYVYITGGTSPVFTNGVTGNYTKTGSGSAVFGAGNSFNNDGAVNVSAGTLQLNGGGTNSGTGTFNTSSGATTLFSNDYTVADGSALGGLGTYQVSGGTFTVTGNVAVSNFNQTGGVLAGTHIFGGTSALTWTGGNWSTAGTTTIGSTATLTISSGNDHDYFGHGIVNNGTVNWTGGQIRSGGGGTITNNGIWNDSASTNYVYITGGTSPVITNGVAGNYTKTGSGTTLFGPGNSFNNSGAVNVTAGILQLNGGGANSATGTFNTSSGATTLFSNDYSVADGSALGGLGTYQVSGGTFTVTGNVAVSNFNQTGGALAGTQIFGGTSALTWTGGNWSTAGTTTIGSTASLTISSGNDHDYFGRAIVNSGTVNWTGGQIRSGGGGTITNNGNWNDSASTNYVYITGGTFPIFTNALGATYTKSGSGTTTLGGIAFNNSGAVVVSGGGLTISGGGSNAATGTFTTASGATTTFNSAFTIADGSALGGAGAYQLTSNTLTVSGNVSVSTFNQTGGTLAGTQAFNNTAINWTSGNWNSAGTTTLGGGTILNITSGNDHDYDGRAIVNNGTVNWSAGRIRSGDHGSITNNGHWNDTASYEINANYNDGIASFTNTSGGDYNKSAGSTNINVPLTNSGTISVTNNSTLSLNAGGLFNSGSTISASSGSIAQLVAGTVATNGTVHFDNFLFNGGQISGSSTFAGTLTWQNGNLNNVSTTTIGAGSTLAIVGGADHDYDGHAIVNNGIVNWTAGRIRSGDHGSITNNAQWNDTASYELNANYNDGIASFINAAAGTYNKSAGNTNINVPLINSGTVSVTNNSSLSLTAGGTLNTGATLSAATGSTLQLVSGTLATNGTVNLTNFLFNGGQISGTSTIAGTVTWQNGNLNNGATTTIGSGSTLGIVGGSDHDYDGHTLVNNGTVNWTAGRIRSGDHGSITNNAQWNDTASYELNADYNDGIATFTNAAGGVYNKSAGATNVRLNFVNSGTINVTNNSTFSLSAGATFNNGSTLSVANGLAQLVSGTLTANGTVNVTNFVLNGGILSGNQTFNGSLTWLNGTMNNAFATEIGAGSVFTISGGSDHDFDQHAIINAAGGIVNWTGGRLRSGDSGSITNAGLWNDSASFEINAAYNDGVATFINQPTGLYNKTAGTTTVRTVFDNNGGSILVSGNTTVLHFTNTFIQSFGTIAVGNGGTLQFDQSGGLNLAAGALLGNGTVIGGVSSAGIISPSTGSFTGTGTTGILHITGNLSLASLSYLLFELGGSAPGTGYDVITVSGTATLGGSILAVGFTNGYVPVSTDSFTVLSAGALSGNFSNVADLGHLTIYDPSGSTILGTFLVNYGSGGSPNSVVLSNFVPVPEPSTWALLGVGSLLALLRRRFRRGA
jgi:hypothetical protein